MQDALDEFLDNEAKEKKDGYENWSHVRDDSRPTRTYNQIIAEDGVKENESETKDEEEIEEEEEEIGELIEMEYAKPPRDDMDCESICSTYSNLLNHPKVVMQMFWSWLTCSAPKKIGISKKTGLPIVPREEYGYRNEVIRRKPQEEEEEEYLVPVENLGEKRNKGETKEEKRLRKQQVKEMKNAKRQQKKMLKTAFAAMRQGQK